MISPVPNIVRRAEEPSDIRAVKREEADAMLELMCRAFHLEPDNAKRIYYSDPFFRLELKRVLVGAVSGNLISCMTLVPTVLRIHPSETLDVCGIAGVCTEPEFQRMGYARRLIERTLSDIPAQLGYDITALTAERPAYYEQLGWGVCGVAVEWSAPANSLPAYEEREYVRELSGESLAQHHHAIEKLYALARGSVEAGAFVRDQRRWRCIEKLGVGRRVAVFERDGVVAAYAAFDVRIVESGKLAYVHEILARDSVARRAMIGFFSTGRHGSTVAGRCSHSDATSLGLFTIPGVTIVTRPNLFMRLTNLTGLLGKILNHVPAPSELGRFANGLAIRVVSNEMERAKDGPEHAAVIRASGRRLQILDRSEAGHLDNWVEGDPGAITQLLIGFKSSSELVSEGRLRLSGTGDGIRPFCDALFPRLQPFLGVPDVF